jgi:hypothetical protein
MKKFSALFLMGALTFAQTPPKQAAALPPLPALRRAGQTVQMNVDGKPYLMLAGELHNSSASSPAYMRPIWEKLSSLHLNTVIGTASWELAEPVEGNFDFSAVDSEIAEARRHGMRLVLIWFGTWKNASSSYVPMWVKRDPRRFPVAKTKSGKPGFMGLPIDALSPLGENTIAADAKAFRALMRHIREVDPRHTVIMMQVENETGLLGDSRDRSALAEAAWAKPVPPALMNYLVEHKATLLPEVTRVWGAQDFKTAGTWAEVFGTDAFADEIFMSWFVGRAVGKVAEAGKAELAIPMYANAWLGPQPKQDRPGPYPSGGPVTGMLDIWRAAAPKLDLFAPDVYVADFQGVCAGYVRSGNPLFIPEARASLPNLFWAVAHHRALGYSPFGIEDLQDFKALGAAYETLAGLAPLLLRYQADGKVTAVIEGNAASVTAFEEATGLSVRFGGLRALFAPPASKNEQQKDLPPAPATDQDFSIKPEKDTRGFALAIQTAPHELVIAGSGLLLTSGRACIGTIDEGRFENGRWQAGRRLNGDESISGNFVLLGQEIPEVRKVVIYTEQ